MGSSSPSVALSVSSAGPDEDSSVEASTAVSTESFAVSFSLSKVPAISELLAKSRVDVQATVVSTAVAPLPGGHEGAGGGGGGEPQAIAAMGKINARSRESLVSVLRVVNHRRRSKPHRLPTGHALKGDPVQYDG